MRIFSWLLVLVVLAAIAIIVALLYVPRFNYTTVVALPTAETPDGRYVGIGDPQGEVPVSCPVGIAFTGAKNVALLDADTERLLDIDTAAGAVTSASPLALPASVGARAMAFGDGALWVWVE